MQNISVMITSFNRPTNDQGGADLSGHGSSAPHGRHRADTSKGTPRPHAAPLERIWACGHGLTGGGTLSSHRSAGSCARTNAINCASHTSENQSGAWGPLPGTANFEAQSGRGCGVIQLPMPIVRRPPPTATINACRACINRHLGQVLLCTVCSWCSYNPDTLKRHMRNKHT